jgi:hypothetical protein
VEDFVCAGCTDASEVVGERESVPVALQAPISTATKEASAARVPRRRKKDAWDIVITRL